MAGEALKRAVEEALKVKREEEDFGFPSLLLLNIFAIAIVVIATAILLQVCY